MVWECLIIPVYLPPFLRRHDFADKSEKTSFKSLISMLSEYITNACKEFTDWFNESRRPIKIGLTHANCSRCYSKIFTSLTFA